MTLPAYTCTDCHSHVLADHAADCEACDAAFCVDCIVYVEGGLLCVACAQDRYPVPVEYESSLNPPCHRSVRARRDARHAVRSAR